MTMKISEYKKIEDLKLLVSKTLLDLEMSEQVRVINNDDLNDIIFILLTMELSLKDFKTAEQKMDFLWQVIIVLIATMRIDYGINLKNELG